MLSDKVDVETIATAHEFVGTVTATGEQTGDFKTGDRVVAAGPCNFSNYQLLPTYACVRLSDSELSADVSTLPVVFASAIYALRDRANIQENESVLIHSAASALGQAVIQIARLHGARIFATVGSEAKKDYLVETYGLAHEAIFDSRTSDFVGGILGATNGYGADIIVNTTVGEILHDSWQLVAPFGRFIELGKQDIAEHGHLDMGRFAHGTSFSAFDLDELFHSPLSRHKRKFARQVILLLHARVRSADFSQVSYNKPWSFIEQVPSVVLLQSPTLTLVMLRMLSGINHRGNASERWSYLSKN